MIILRDRRRAAALHLLDNTPLGDTFARLDAQRLATYDADRDRLTLGLHKHAERTLSSGEYALWAFLVALTHGNAINLHRCSTASTPTASAPWSRPSRSGPAWTSAT